MNLRSPKGPKELRTAMHAAYEAYARGEVNFPRILVVGNEEEISDLPRKSQPITTALFKTWERINAGRDTHRELVEFHRANPHEAVANGYGKGAVLNAIGENALALTLFIPVNGVITEESRLIGPRSIREEFLEHFDVELADGRLIERGGFDGVPPPDLEIDLPINGGISMVGHWEAAPQTPQQPQQEAA